jgi:IS30 family transposase
MAHKVGLNKKEQVQCAVWLAEEVNPKLIAKKLHVDVSTVMKFTQRDLNAAKAKSKAREDAYKKQKKANEEKAQVLKAALAPNTGTGDFE